MADSNKPVYLKLRDTIAAAIIDGKRRTNISTSFMSLSKW